MSKLFNQIRIAVVFFIIALVLSGLTALPLITELRFLLNAHIVEERSTIDLWLRKVLKGLEETQQHYPFIFYGFDWLAFAHIVIAILFLGVYQHPVRNRWIIQWAIITCIGVVPLALIAGSIRGVPFFHILIDCAFGVVGLVPLFFIQNRINKLKKYRTKEKYGQ